MERFWSKVAKSDGCWLWQAATHRFGYGMFSLDGRTTTAHRVSWALTNGPVPGGLHVLHRCDVPACVRPDHLFLGTPTDNMQDCAKKERQGRRKLTALTVAEIRRRYDNGGVSQRALAREFNVTQTLIWYVLHRIAWGFVEDGNGEGREATDP